MTRVINEQRLELMKVWYAAFVTIMDMHDAGDMNDHEFLEALSKLRETLREQGPESEL